MRGARSFCIAILAVGMAIPVAACTPGGTAGPASVSAKTVASSAPKAVTPPPPAPPKRPEGRSLAQIVERIVLTRSEDRGAVLDSAEWQNLSATICSDLAAGGTGLFLSHAATDLPAEDQWDLTDLYLDGAIEGTCTSAKKPPAPAGMYYQSDMSMSLVYGLTGEIQKSDIEYQRLLTQYIKDVTAYGLRYNEDVRHLLAAVPASSGGSSGSGGSGYNVVCADGWVSSSGGKQGACSHHGGVR